ncbi:hypothetical protein LZ30DRAFT_705054 [Colletotrichum cereale]|nr:hypothetical protein LZ30DRAFT_705054 [Colletotrichum cereale]
MQAPTSLLHAARNGALDPFTLYLVLPMPVSLDHPGAVFLSNICGPLWARGEKRARLSCLFACPTPAVEDIATVWSVGQNSPARSSPGVRMTGFGLAWRLRLSIANASLTLWPWTRRRNMRSCFRMILMSEIAFEKSMVSFDSGPRERLKLSHLHRDRGPRTILDGWDRGGGGAQFPDSRAPVERPLRSFRRPHERRCLPRREVIKDGIWFLAGPRSRRNTRQPPDNKHTGVEFGARRCPVKRPKGASFASCLPSRAWLSRSHSGSSPQTPR